MNREENRANGLPGFLAAPTLPSLNAHPLPAQFPFNTQRHALSTGLTASEFTASNPAALHQREHLVSPWNWR